MTRFASLTSRLYVALVLLFGIAACGGGGGGSDGGGFLPDDASSDKRAYTLELLLTDSAGLITDTVTSTTPAVLTVTVFVGKNTQPGIVVSASATIGRINPISGTALTDANGVATFEIAAGLLLGAGSIEVSIEPEDAAEGVVTESITFQVGAPSLRIGRFEDNVFIDGELGIPADSVPTGGTTLVNLAVVDDEDQAVETPVEVSLRSDCSVNGLADLPDTVTTANGRATAVYTATGCGGTDSITATVVDGTGQAFGTISIASPQAGSINFISATPESKVIALKGTGGPGRQETSEIVFEVVTGTGTPISGANVQFSLSTEVGGLSLNTSSALSDSAGLVSAYVASGDVATAVRVIATIEVDDGNGNILTLSTVSDILAVTTGLPDQDSISLSSSTLNVAGAMNLDDLTAEITVRMADKFNNPVPDGTAAVFTTEFGVIGDSCTTVDGKCTVDWISQSPRFPGSNGDLIRTIENTPCPSSKVKGYGPCPADLGTIRAGRSTLLVTAIGEESFADVNGNGKYDQEEKFGNLPEAFIDHNEDGVFTPFFDPSDASGEDEEPVDFNHNGAYDLNDNPPWYNGILCPLEGDDVWCSRDLLNVRASLTLVMSEQIMSIILVNSSGTQVSGTTQGPTYTIYIADLYNNPPASDATISVTPSNGCEILNDPVTTPPETNAIGAFGIPIQTSGDGEESGNFTVSVENGGGESSRTFSCVWPIEEPVDCDFSPQPPECTDG